MKKQKQEGWYAKKSFPHFDLPLGFADAKALVSSPRTVAQHSYKPFIGYVDKKRRFTPKSSKSYKIKERPIKYCSHHDGYIHSYYAMALNDSYEQFLSDKPWANCVIGYRSGKGTNIHMAKNAFNELRKPDASVAIAIDINDFFGSIDHSVLLQNLKRVLNFERLPDDWFSIFKSMTKFAWLDSDDLVERLNFDPKKPPRPLCTIEKFRRLREEDPAFVKRNTKAYGIPQGSPISAVLSNVYMIDFDAACHQFMKDINGYYRRYSDDIFIVCRPEYREAVENFVSEEIRKLGNNIIISPEKTEVSYFYRDSNGLSCDTPISYLGFTFDGARTKLRARTLSRYYRRMTYASRHTANAAKDSKVGKVFKRKLYRPFTHLGRSNFYSYAKRASSILEDEAPKRQLRRHFPILHRKLQRRGK